jgi:predicted aspartyl protease
MIDHTNIPINLFDEMIDKLITNDRYIVMNNEDIQNTNHKIFLSADKIKYTQLVAIYDINNNLLGFVAAEMTHAYSKDLADKEKESLNKLVKQLVPVLSYSEYTTMKTQ